MQIHFNRADVKNRQVFLRDKILMTNDPKLFMGGVKPCGHMPPGDKKDPICPIRILFKSSEKIPHQPVIPVSLLAKIIHMAFLVRFIFFFFGHPRRIASVHPWHHDIDFIRHNLSFPRNLLDGIFCDSL